MSDPSAYLVTVTARDGTPLTIRALRPADRERMAIAIRGLDPESVYLRLFSRRAELTEAGLDRVMRFDPDREVVLVATVAAAGAERIVGSARYVVGEPRVAEVAFVVEEDFHGRGIAGHLLRHLGHVARAQGIGVFEADVLAANKAMHAVFARTGWALRSQRDGDAVHLTLALPDVAD